MPNPEEQPTLPESEERPEDGWRVADSEFEFKEMREEPREDNN